MRNQYKLLAEKYQAIQENIKKPAFVISQFGDKIWRQNGKLHRLDGPAYEYSDGTKEWYQNDKRHRLDGPAFEYSDGTKEWYQNGRQHRLDGPAVEHPDGTKEWYINGIELTEDEFNKWKWKHDQHEALKKASAETGIEMDI